MSHRNFPGTLLVIDGIDGAGKTTQTELVAARLESVGLPVVRTKEPTDGPWGRRIRQSAASGRMPPAQELEAFVADRREHVENLLTPSLQAGKIVIVDRYYFSSAAYQGARGMDPEAILQSNEEFAPQPDLLIILQVPAAVGVRRVAARGDVGNLFEKEEDLARSAEIFARMSRPYLARIDGTQSRETIADEIVARLSEGALFPRLCVKSHYKDACEPAYCSVRIAGQCDFIKLRRRSISTDESSLLSEERTSRRVQPGLSD